MRNFACCVCWVLVCVRSCVRERERDSYSCSAVCVCVCVWERESQLLRRVCVCARVCVREGDTVTQPRLVCKCIWASLLSLTRLCSPLGLVLMVKLRTLLTVFTLVLKAEALDYGKGRYISDAACGVRPITMHWVSWPIRAIFHSAPPPQTWHTQVYRLTTPTGTSAHENEWHEICCVFRQLATHGAEIQLGKLAVGGFHKPKQRPTFRPPNTHFQRRITDCCIVFQIDKYVNLACFLNICKHIMVFLCFSRVTNVLHL